MGWVLVAKVRQGIGAAQDVVYQPFTLPRRTKLVKQQLDKVQIQAEKSAPLSFENETFKSSNAGILMFLPLIKRYEIDTVIAQSNYPGTSVISKASSILCFLALKLASRRRYSSDDTWCMDRGMGLFAGLNVLPKTAWYTSYSDRVTTEMNQAFLKLFWNLLMKSRNICKCGKKLLTMLSN
ncbi:MAG: hypothetical protein Q8M08_03140 [Bacteroidales bacterium]|nr:hypothetical protein [Bacteroidales bacterium]